MNTARHPAPETYLPREDEQGRLLDLVSALIDGMTDSGANNGAGAAGSTRAKDGTDGDAEPVEVKVELPVDAHLPHDYVPGERLRLEVYKKLAAVKDDAELADIIAEVTDRYGTPPQPVRALFEVARLRTLARRAGVEMPLTEAVRAVCYDGVPVSRAMDDLLNRDVGGEWRPKDVD